MPLYYSVYYSFPYHAVTDSFVEQVYQQFFEYYPFQSGYRESEHDSLSTIMKWNTDLLANKFKLGYDQHVEYDYKQLLLSSTNHSKVRLFWSYESEEVTLHLTTPENDIIMKDGTYHYKASQLHHFLSISINLWNRFKMNNVQTYQELDAPMLQVKIASGLIPAINPFCIVDIATFEKMMEQLEHSRYIFHHVNQGVLIIEKSYESLIDELNSHGTLLA